jgi:hypothetical protein
MSTSAEPARPAPPPEDVPTKIISHTGLLYWWPVWLVGFILAGLTWFERTRLAVVPAGTTVKEVREKTYELTVPKDSGAAVHHLKEATQAGQDAFPVAVSGNRNYGMIYVVVLLLVIFATNVPLRGLWSALALMMVFLVALLLAIFDLWGGILRALGDLHIHFTLAGFLVPSVVLLVLWVATVFGFDQLRYVRVTPGQLAVHQDIGDAVKVYDATHVMVRKRRSDLIRHWMLGFGAGDLIIDIPGQSEQIVLTNVLFVAAKVQLISDQLKTRQVVTG